MYRALYEYKTNLPNYLSFTAGDQFTILDGSNRDWFMAQNGYGEIGYIPKNYVTVDDVSHQDVLKSIDRAIEVIHYQTTSSDGALTHQQRENLQKLIQHRKNVVDQHRGQRSPSSPLSPGSPVSPTSPTSPGSYGNGKRRQAPVAPGSASSGISNSSSGKRSSARRVAPPPPTGKEETIQKDHSAGEHQGETSNDQLIVDKTKETNCVNNDVGIGNASGVDIPDTADQLALNNVNTVDCATSPIKSPSQPMPISPVKQHGSQSGHLNLESVHVPGQLGQELVEAVRRNTGLSYDKSGIAVETLLGHLSLQIPDIAPLLDKVFVTLQESSTVTEEESSQDFGRLQELFLNLTECKDDSQQRSWALLEDEAMITGYLEELQSILENAKQSISKRAIAAENYECVHNLVQYYQMETRVNLRLMLLRVFGAMCGLDNMVISMLLFSVLTTELAAELQNEIGDLQRSCHVSLLMTMIFSTGEHVPANLHDHLNSNFVSFVFDNIETPVSIDHEEELTDLLVHLILAFNLHFENLEENFIMTVLAEKGTVKVFTEKILLLFNRGDDPVHMFEYEPRPPNSVMKLLQDLYSSDKTAFLLYTNDAKVLIDIIVRQLADLSAGDQLRTSHLYLMQLIIQNSDYSEHEHRASELGLCFRRILAEEEMTDIDKAIVTAIMDHSDLFS